MGDTADELTSQYRALRTGAVLVDLSARGRMRFTGAKAADVLTGLVTNDVAALTHGHGLYAAALTPKGRVIADPWIFAGEGWFLTDVPERAHEGWNALIQKFVNPRLSRYTDETSETCAIGIFGPRAAANLASTTGVDPTVVGSLPMLGHIGVALGPHSVLIARIPDAGLPGFEIIAPSSARDALLSELLRGAAVMADAGTLDVARVEAGRPAWGVDMDDTTIPQEANFDELDAISYSKGCYTGQEVVARIHFRGHVNRHLRGLRAEDAGGQLRSGAVLVDENDAEVGDVRSSVHSPRMGRIALAMIRREVPDGASLLARWEPNEQTPAGESRVRVATLPFVIE